MSSALYSLPPADTEENEHTLKELLPLKYEPQTHVIHDWTRVFWAGDVQTSRSPVRDVAQSSLTAAWSPRPSDVSRDIRLNTPKATFVSCLPVCPRSERRLQGSQP